MKKTNENINEKINAVAKAFSEKVENREVSIPTVATKNGEVVRKEYKLVNPKGKTTTLTTFDQSLIESTEKIGVAFYGMSIAENVICRELAKIDDSGVLEKIGFKSIAEYAECMFGMQRVWANQCCRIGKLFLNDDYEINSAILPHGLSKGHLLEFLAYTDKDDDGVESRDISKIESFYTDGILSDGMSTKAIRKALKENVKGIIIDGEAKEVDSDSENNKSTNREKGGNGEAEEKEITPEILVARILNACTIIEDSIKEINANREEQVGVSKEMKAIRAICDMVLNG